MDKIKIPAKDLIAEAKKHELTRLVLEEDANPLTHPFYMHLVKEKVPFYLWGKYERADHHIDLTQIEVIY